RIGRKTPIIVGAALTLVLLFPIFWGIGALANPGLNASARTAPVEVLGSGCEYDPFASKQATPCGRLLADLSSLGVAYDVAPGAMGVPLTLKVGAVGTPLAGGAEPAAVQQVLEARGYDFSKQHPPLASLAGIVVLLLGLAALSALTYGSVAALLAEMFPPQIRYSSMSIPYHIGAGYLGGFLPLIASYIVATTGNAYAGLWYTWGVVAFGLVVAWWGLKGGKPSEFESADSQPAAVPATA
ncbi:MAG: MFS transporter, partial [Tsuneonella sp.]